MNHILASKLGLHNFPLFCLQRRSNHYKTLGINKDPRSATNEEIRQAYLSLTKKFHPDIVKHKNSNNHNNKFVEINEAYSVLSDSRKRSQYDQTLCTTSFSTSLNFASRPSARTSSHTSYSAYNAHINNLTRDWWDFEHATKNGNFHTKSQTKTSTQQKTQNASNAQNSQNSQNSTNRTKYHTKTTTHTTTSTSSHGSTSHSSRASGRSREAFGSNLGASEDFYNEFSSFAKQYYESNTHSNGYKSNSRREREFDLNDAQNGYNTNNTYNTYNAYDANNLNNSNNANNANESESKRASNRYYPQASFRDAQNMFKKLSKAEKLEMRRAEKTQKRENTNSNNSSNSTQTSQSSQTKRNDDKNGNFYQFWGDSSESQASRNKTENSQYNGTNTSNNSFNSFNSAQNGYNGQNGKKKSSGKDGNTSWTQFDEGSFWNFIRNEAEPSNGSKSGANSHSNAFKTDYDEYGNYVNLNEYETSFGQNQKFTENSDNFGYSHAPPHGTQAAQAAQTSQAKQRKQEKQDKFLEEELERLKLGSHMNTGDIVMPIELSAVEAKFGCTKDVRFLRNELHLCSRCHGVRSEECQQCRGCGKMTRVEATNLRVVMPRGCTHGDRVLVAREGHGYVVGFDEDSIKQAKLSKLAQKYQNRSKSSKQSKESTNGIEMDYDENFAKLMGSGANLSSVSNVSNASNGTKKKTIDEKEDAGVKRMDLIERRSDLWILCEVRESCADESDMQELFHWQDNCIHVIVKLPLKIALNGGVIDVPSIDSNCNIVESKIRVLPGTMTGDYKVQRIINAHGISYDGSIDYEFYHFETCEREDGVVMFERPHGMKSLQMIERNRMNHQRNKMIGKIRQMPVEYDCDGGNGNIFDFEFGQEAWTKIDEAMQMNDAHRVYVDSREFEKYYGAGKQLKYSEEDEYRY